MDLMKTIMRSGPCVDRAFALKLYLAALRRPWARRLAIASRFRFSPLLLDALRASPLPPGEKAELFSAAMNLFRSGGSYKTTAADRSPLTDAAVLARLRPGARLLEAGVSDGISALGLLGAAPGAEIILSDRQAAFHASGTLFRRIYGFEDGELFVKLPCFLLCTGLPAGAPPAGAAEISPLNPAVEAAFPGVKLAAFDVFTGRLERRADVIKCANVLNKAYFGLPDIGRALKNLSSNLEDGGWLVIGHNNPRYEGGEAFLALRREGGALALREERNGHELLADIRSGAFGAEVRA